MNKLLRTFCLLSLILSFKIDVFARQPYQAVVTVGTDHVTVNAPNLVDLRRNLQTNAIETLVPIYTPTSPVTFDINLRGLIALTSFAANSTVLIVNIPNAGISTSFDGGSRDASIALFKSYIQDGESIPQLLKAYAKYSPIDPIAGNPNSLIAKMAEADFLTANLSPLSSCNGCWNAQPIVHQFQAGTYGLRAFSKGYDTTTVTMPLRYSFSPDERLAFIIDAPFTYIRNGGASSVIGSLGVGLRIPVTFDWSLTAITRVGSGGSVDLACSGNFVSLGVLSLYNHRISYFSLSLINYIGFFTSTNLWLGGVNFNYHLQKTIFKNGLAITSCKEFTVFKRPLYFKVSFTDTFFGGNRFYLNHFDEIRVELFTTKINPCIHYDCLTLGFVYQFGQKNYKAYALNTTYQF